MNVGELIMFYRCRCGQLDEIEFIFCYFNAALAISGVHLTMRIRYFDTIDTYTAYELRKIKKYIHATYRNDIIGNTLYMCLDYHEIYRPLDIIDNIIRNNYDIFTLMQNNVLGRLIQAASDASDLIQMKYMYRNNPDPRLIAGPCFLMLWRYLDPEWARQKYNGVLVDLDQREVIELNIKL